MSIGRLGVLGLVCALSLAACGGDDDDDDDVVGCSLDSECDDGDACTADVCTAAGTCDNTDLDIDDEVACTEDLCDSATGEITHTAMDTACSDSDGASCTVATCDPEDAAADAVTGCVEVADDSACDDTLACTTDTCDPSDGGADATTGCVIALNDAACDDSLDCTSDACVGAGGDADGCEFTPNDGACSEADGFSCTVPTCVVGTGCTEVATDAMCTDSVGCTTDTCVGAGGDSAGCAFTPDDGACAEVDGFSCTVPTCDAATDCSEVATDAMCDDTLACTTDTCVGAGGDTAGCLLDPIDLVCEAGEFCSTATDCTAAMGGDQDGNVIITEMIVLGPNSGELIELHNTTGADIDIAGYTFKDASGATAEIRAVTDLDGAGGDPVVLAGGAYAYGIANPTGGATGGADFVYGVVGDSFALDDTGDVLGLFSTAGALEDAVDFTSFNSDPATNVTDGQFPASAAASTQLHSATLTAADNDDGNNWCTTFYSASVRSRVPDTAGADNGSCSALVINELLYDYDHPTIGAADGGRVFVELAGPGGAQLAGVRVLGIDDDGVTLQSPNVTIGSTGGTTTLRMPLDGLYVMADGDTNDGVTEVPEADMVVGSGDPQNGPDGLQLFDSLGTLIDSVAYGAPGVNETGEGLALHDLSPTDHAISLARNETSDDTDDNSADFFYDPSPTPGAQNTPLAPAIVSVTPDNAPATATATVTIVARDFAGHGLVNGSAIGADNADATFISNTTAEDCVELDIADGGRGDGTWRCTAPSNSGVVETGDFVFTNPALLGGGSDTIVGGWTYTGVLNESDVAAEADFCNLQFPATLSETSGGTSADVFGQIFEAGVTEAAGPGAGIIAELGFGAIGSDPTLDGNWLFTPAAFNVQVGNNDEYVANMSVPTVVATTDFAYTYRFSFDGGLNYTYCDTDGAGSNVSLSFDPGSLGVMTVNP